jgi:hypothetical protein
VLTSAQKNAIGTAQDYLSTQAFSRKSLIEQLKYEKYSTKLATFAVDAVHANWNTEAMKSAKEYLSTQHFSRGSLIEQLEYEGFTSSQAHYGVKKAGL